MDLWDCLMKLADLFDTIVAEVIGFLIWPYLAYMWWSYPDEYSEDYCRDCKAVFWLGVVSLGAIMVSLFTLPSQMLFITATLTYVIAYAGCRYTLAQIDSAHPYPW